MICYNGFEKGSKMGLKRRDNTELVLQTLDELKKPKKLTKEEKKVQSFLEKIEFARTESTKLYNPDDYRIIREEKELLEYIELGNKCGYISIDTETTGLEFYKDTVVGLCLYVDGERACYCPYGHIDYFTGELVENQLSKESIIKALLSITARIIMHNADFDIRTILFTYGVRLKCWWDTQIAGYILNENESHKLKDLHGKYISKQDEATFGDLFNKIGFQYVPIDIGYMYAAHDAIDTRELQQFQAKYLRPDHPREDFRNLYYVFRNIEMDVLEATINMEETGVYLDMPYTESIIPKYEEKLQKALDECYKELLPYKEQCLTHEQLDNPVNLSSPKQVAIVLYDIMKIKPIDGRKVGEEILEKINSPFTKALLDYRGASKLLSTYIIKLPKVRQKDDKIHCSFKQTGTSTGRYSSKNPNLQNVPSHDKYIRPMFCGGIDYREVEDLTFEKCEEVELSDGEWKFVELLKVGEEIVTDDGVYKITNVEVQPSLLGKVILQIESKG